MSSADVQREQASLDAGMLFYTRRQIRLEGDHPGSEPKHLAARQIPTFFDAELDTPRRPPTPTTEEVSACQRVIINPLLAILGWILAVVLIRYSTRTGNLLLYLAALLWLFIPFLLIQFHCLDCRTTGWFWRVRRHACDTVLARWIRRESPRDWLPSVHVQIHIWIYTVSAAAILYFVMVRR
jgi:hypothetical protein